MAEPNIPMTKSNSFKHYTGLDLKRTVLICVCIILTLNAVTSFNVDTKNVKVFRGPNGIYFGYSLAMLRNTQGNW